jgi:hypothetical protein
MKKFGVYFVTDGKYLSSYIGFSISPTIHRWRCHALKHKASAKRTKTFDSCHLIARIEGFPTKNTGLSYEWYAKSRRSKLKIRKYCLRLKNPIHPRLSDFFAPFLHPKFELLKSDLTVFILDPHDELCNEISEFYNVQVKKMPIPYLPCHIDAKKRFK